MEPGISILPEPESCDQMPGAAQWMGPRFARGRAGAVGVSLQALG